MLFTDHVRHLASICFYWLRQLRSIEQTLTMATMMVLVHTLVISQIDYCNSVPAGTWHRHQLHRVIKTAARLTVGKQKYHSISSTIRDILYWLPIHQCVEFKMCVLVYNCPHNISPCYLSSKCQTVSVNPSHRCLRLAARGDLDSHNISLLWPLQFRCRRTSHMELSASTPWWPNVCRFISLSTQDWTFQESIRPSFSMLVILCTVRVGKHKSSASAATATATTITTTTSATATNRTILS